MENIAKCILEIGSASGRNAKLSLLEKFAGVEGFKDVLQFIYNPYIRTGIAKAKLAKARGNMAHGTLTYADVIEYFTEYQTGRDEDAGFAKAFVTQFDKDSDARKVAEAMVTKNLKIGVTEKTLNKVYGKDFIPMIGIMKAEKYGEFRDKVKGPFITTEKLDGARRLLIKENGNIAMYSRSGIPDEGLVDIEQEASYLPDNTVFDGELLAIGEFSNSIELRQATMSIANRKGVRHGLTFNVFDLIPIEEFKKGKSKADAFNRKVLLGALFGDASIKHLVAEPDYIIHSVKIDHTFKFIKPVPILGVSETDEDVFNFARPIWARGFEGVMLNTPDGLYDLTKDRSREILKVKHIVEYTLKVVDIEEGTNKNEGKVGSLIVDYNGQRVGVGSGLTDDMREAFWRDPSLVIGKEIEIDSFGESENKQGGVSLNCPIFKRIAGQYE